MKEELGENLWFSTYDEAGETSGKYDQIYTQAKFE